MRGGAFIVALALAVALERWRPHSRSRPSVTVNGGMWLVGATIMGGVCGACAWSASCWAAAAGVGALNVVAAPLWIAVPATVLALDLVSYGWHRANHVVPVLWRFHRVHHSDPTFTASTALRFHPGELVLSLPLRLLAIVLLGAPAVAIVVFEALFAVSNLVEHGDVDLPPVLERRLGAVLVTPALHRFHHARAQIDRDHNFATIFIVWDRLLGTVAPSSSAARIEVGLPDVEGPVGLGEALGMPLRG